MSICLSFLSISVNPYLSIYLSIYQSNSIHVYLSVFSHDFSLSISIYLSIYLSNSIHIYLSVFSVYCSLSISIYLHRKKAISLGWAQKYNLFPLSTPMRTGVISESTGKIQDGTCRFPIVRPRLIVFHLHRLQHCKQISEQINAIFYRAYGRIIPFLTSAFTKLLTTIKMWVKVNF